MRNSVDGRVLTKRSFNRFNKGDNGWMARRPTDVLTLRGRNKRALHDDAAPLAAVPAELHTIITCPVRFGAEPPKKMCTKTIIFYHPSRLVSVRGMLNSSLRGTKGRQTHKPLRRLLIGVKQAANVGGWKQSDELLPGLM